MQTRAAVVAFMEAINAHDVDRIVGLCTPDHRFIDAHGGVVTVDGLRSAWSGYFGFMPVYGVSADAILCDGDEAAVFGAAWGSLTAGSAPDQCWRRPCAWRARTADGRLALWQVFVDTKAVFDLL